MPTTPGRDEARTVVVGERSVTLRRFTPSDEAALFACFRQVVADGEGYPQDPALTLRDADIRDYWVSSRTAVVVATEAPDAGGRFLGSYFLSPNGVGRAAHVANAGYLVVRDARGAGLGRALVEDSFVVARNLGFDAMQFNFVFASNPARRLYERLGFREVGRVPRVIDGEDVLVYWRSLVR